MSNIKYGVQLFSVREPLQEDLEGTFAELAKMGYEGVEFFGDAPDSAENLKELLEKYDLECCGWHYWGDPLELIKDESKLKETVDLYQTLGNENLIVSSVPEEYRGSTEGWLNIAENFNEIMESLKQYDIKLGYHNHDFEFVNLEGKTPWEILFDNTDNDIIMQLDTGNAYKGGGEVLEMLKKYSHRAQSVHLKPFSKSLEEKKGAGFKTMIGEDETPWQEIFTICHNSGDTEWYIIEYETDVYEPLVGVEKCLKNTKDIIEKM